MSLTASRERETAPGLPTPRMSSTLDVIQHRDIVMWKILFALATLGVASVPSRVMAQDNDATRVGAATRNDRAARADGVAPQRAVAQQDVDTPPPPRRYTLLMGGGNAMGWFGAQFETYFAAERLSAFAGLGYVTEDMDAVSGAAGAVGIRGFTPGVRHRGLLELSVSQIATSESYGFGGPQGDTYDRRHHYGPGIQGGYQYVSDGGFTFLVSAGLGYALDTPGDAASVQGLGGLGFGYTWRRR